MGGCSMVGSQQVWGHIALCPSLFLELMGTHNRWHKCPAELCLAIFTT